MRFEPCTLRVIDGYVVSSMKKTQIAYCGSFRMQFWESRDLFADLTAEELTVRIFLPR